jgi:hypothetical protein
MARFYIATDAAGWHRSPGRPDIAVNCSELAGSSGVIEWPSSLSSEQRTYLTGQWLQAPAGPLYDEWIPAEWLLRAYVTPAMAAVDLKHGEFGSRVFEIAAEPLVLGRSIRVVIPELGMAGVRRFHVCQEVPGWWLYGPNGVHVLALLYQYRQRDVLETVLAASAQLQASWRNLMQFLLFEDVLAIADATRRIGAVTLADALTRGTSTQHGKLAAERAFQAAVGLILRDVLVGADALYKPWLAIFGSPEKAAEMDIDNVAYPRSVELPE